MSRQSKQSQREQSHERILAAAARSICRDGYAGLGVASVMKDAGLTHGGFYAHFESRDALLTEAVSRAGAKSIERMQVCINDFVAQGMSPLQALIEGYLSDLHSATVDEGCPVAALASEMPRVSGKLRDASAERMLELIGLVADTLPAANGSGAAVAIASSLVGALQMARMFDGEKRNEVLRECRAALLAQHDNGGN